MFIDSGTAFVDLDHNTKTYRKFGFATGSEDLDKTALAMAQNIIQEKGSQPIKKTEFKTVDIKIKRATKGLLNNKERTDEISDYICRVFNLFNMKVIQKTRKEHLKFKNTEDLNKARNVNGITDIEYFSASNPKELASKDVGLARKIESKESEVKATVWSSEEFPCSVQEQLMPVLRLMSLINSHFEKLSNFISIDLPKGFPVRLGKCATHLICIQTLIINVLLQITEIPVVFLLLNAQVTFGNVHSLKTPVDGVVGKQLDEKNFQCTVDENLFTIPPHFTQVD